MTSTPAKDRRVKSAKRPRRRVRRRRVDKGGQALLPFPLTWGGKRPGAGRKPVGKVAGEAHRRRPAPPRPSQGAVHVVIKVRSGLPSLRQARCMRVIWFALVAAKTAYKMRVVHFCVQKNHIHLIIEAPDRKAFLSGMRGLSIRLSKRLNVALGLSGRLLADCYHVEILDNFLRLRRAIAYVLNNTRRHAFQQWRLDQAGAIHRPLQLGLLLRRLARDQGQATALVPCGSSPGRKTRWLSPEQRLATSRTDRHR